MIVIYVTSLLLIGLSGAMLDSHRRSWQAAQVDTKLSERDRRFARSQYRRRTQASSIIGVLGAAIAIWPLIPREPWILLLYLASMAGACLAIVLLAAVDVVATRQNYARLRSEQLAAQVKLARELGIDEH
jgi:hypothetical protein